MSLVHEVATSSGEHRCNADRWPTVIAIGLWACFVSAAIVFLNYSLLRTAAVELYAYGIASRPVALPHSQGGFAGKVYTYSGAFSVGRFTNTIVQITPDDQLLALVVNGREVDLSGIPEGGIRDWINGFHLDLGKYIQRGPNTFKCIVKNWGGPVSLSFRTSFRSGYYMMCLLVIAVAVSGFTISLNRFAGLPTAIMCLIGLGFIIKIFYFGYTMGWIRSYDAFDHVHYVRYILEHGSLPPDAAGRECHQPPAYYILGAVLCRFLSIFGINDIYAVLQSFSLFLDVVFVFIGAKLFSLVVPRIAVCASAILVFWPSGIMNASRVGNDSMLYVVAAAGLYLVICWARNSRPAALIGAAAFLGLGLFTKLSIVPFIAVVGLVVIIRSFLSGSFLWRPIIIASLILICCSGGLYFLKFDHRTAPAGGTQLIPAGASAKLYVGNEIRNYLVFDLRDFLDEPFTSPWHDAGGRQFLANFFLKSSMFGEHNFLGGSSMQVAAAHFLKGILLILLLGALSSMLGSTELSKATYVLCGLLVVVPISAIIALRAHYPLACHQDFRFIYPALFGAIPICLAGLNRISSRLSLPPHAISIIITIAWVASVGVFFFAEYFK